MLDFGEQFVMFRRFILAALALAGLVAQPAFAGTDSVARGMTASASRGTVVMQGALDGTTNDQTAANNARASTPINGAIRVPPGGWNVPTAPTTGPASPVRWDFSGNYVGVGTTKISDMGYDTVHNFYGALGGEYWNRAHSTPDEGPIFQVNGTFDQTGGTSGGTMAAFSSTCIDANVTQNNYVWCSRTTMNSYANGPNQQVAVAGYNFKYAGNSPVWGGAFSAKDMTGLGSADSLGGFDGIEVDNLADLDDAQGNRYAIIAVQHYSQNSSATAEFAGSIRAQAPNTGTTVDQSVFSVLNLQADVVYDASGASKRTAPGTTPPPSANSSLANTVTCAVGSPTVTLGTSISAVAGNWLWLNGCGTNGRTLGTTISAITGGTSVTLNTPYPATAQTAASENVYWSGVPTAPVALRMAKGQYIDLAGDGSRLLSYQSAGVLQYYKGIAGVPVGVPIWSSSDTASTGFVLNQNLTVNGVQTFTRGVEFDGSAVVNAGTTSGSTVTIATNTSIEIISATGTLATLTVALPSCIDGRKVTVTFNQTITTLSVTGAGTVVGAPVTAGPALPFTMFCNTASAAWYRI